MLFRSSVRYALDQPSASRDFVRQHAQAMEEEVIRKHIELYVNEFSVSLGKEGRLALETFCRKAVECGYIPRLPDRLFFEGFTDTAHHPLRTEHL